MQALCLNGVADGIDHMNQRHTDGLLNRRGDFVHGVGRQHNGLCAHAFELLGAGCQHGTCLLPIACALQGGNGARAADAKIIADGLNRELVLVKTEWDGLIPALNAGKIDAVIAGMSPTKERKASVDFSDPYYESDLVIVVKKDSPYANAKSLQDFSGARITAQLNTFHYTVIDQIPGVKKQTAMESFPAMIVALSSGKIDGYISERPGAISAMESNPDLTFVEFEEGKGFETSPEDVAIAVALKKGNPDLEAINKIISTITKEKRQEIMDNAIAIQPLSGE